jgi:hypothetical protein
MFKQTNAELDDNKVKVDKALLPAVLGPKAWSDLLPSMGKWLLKNCVEDGLVNASPENMVRAITALDGTGLFDWEKIAPVKTPRKKQPDFQQSNGGTERPNHARRAEKAQVVQLAATDVNSPIFQQRNAEAKERFEDLVQRGPITYRFGGIDRGRTAARRELLQKIRIVARQKDSEGAEVPVYEQMCQKVEEQVRKFEAEDARREIS